MKKTLNAWRLMYRAVCQTPNGHHVPFGIKKRRGKLYGRSQRNFDGSYVHFNFRFSFCLLCILNNNIKKKKYAATLYIMIMSIFRCIPGLFYIQIPGLEECLHELLSDRARHLKAMETLTNQLRRREADAEKKAHEGKAIAARLELVEQEKASLEQRMRAGAEEHRTERGRWLAHKQVQHYMLL